MLNIKCNNRKVVEMNAIKINDSLKIEDVVQYFPDQLGFTVRFEVYLDDVRYSLHMQKHELDNCLYFTDAPFYGERSDYSDLYDLLSESDYYSLLSECRKIYISKGGKPK